MVKGQLSFDFLLASSEVGVRMKETLEGGE